MITDYLTTQATILRGPTRDQWGEQERPGVREVVATHYASARRLIRTQAGEEIVASGVFAFASGTVIGPDDRILFEGREHRPVQIVRARTLDGEFSTRVFVL